VKNIFVNEFLIFPSDIISQDRRFYQDPSVQKHIFSSIKNTVKNLILYLNFSFSAISTIENSFFPNPFI
jgi:hypothetical protein